MCPRFHGWRHHSVGLLETVGIKYINGNIADIEHKCVLPNKSKQKDTETISQFGFFCLFQLPCSNETWPSTIIQPRHINTQLTVASCSVAVGERCQVLLVWDSQAIQVDGEFPHGDVYSLLVHGQF